MTAFTASGHNCSAVVDASAAAAAAILAAALLPLRLNRECKWPVDMIA